MRRKRTTPLKDDQINLGSCSTELRARILSNAPYFRGLPQPAIDAVNGLFRSVSHPAGTALYRASCKTRGIKNAAPPHDRG